MGGLSGAAVLTERGMKTMLWAKVKRAVATVVAVGILEGGAVLAADDAMEVKAAEGAMEWPQWRGPNRDGTAPNSPKLMDRWPTNGPTLLWRSELIPSVRDGGCASVVVAGGKVLVYANARPPVSGKTYRPITLEVLTDWGWVANLPDDLAKKIEEARVSSKRRSLKPGEALDAYVREFLATLDPDDAKTYGACIKNRLKWEAGFLSWKELRGMSTLQDKEFKTLQELWNDAAKVVDMHHRYGGVNEAFDAACEKVCRFTDSIICLDAATGKELWRRDFPDPVRAKLPIENYFRLCGASATPAISGDKCYVVASSAMYCLSLKDGSVVWSKPTPAPSNSSPLVDGSVVYAVLCGGLRAVNADTGQLLWAQPKIYQDSSSVVLWTVGQKSYLLCNSGCNCVDSANGEMVWRAPGARGNFSTPVVVDGDTMIRFGESKFESYGISPKGAELIYSKPLMSERVCSPLICQGSVYQNCDICYDFGTGREQWATKDMLAQFSSPILADGKIIAHANNQSRTIMFRPTPGRLDQIGTFAEGVATGTSPAIAGGKLYVRLANCVACYDLAEHRPYLDRVTLKGRQLTLQIGQAEGGLTVKDAPDRPIEGLSMVDASGVAKAAKAQIEGTKLFESDDFDKNTQPTAGENWKLCSNGRGVINIAEGIGRKTNAVAHACVYVFSQTDRKVQIWAGHGGAGLQVFINGTLAYTNTAPFNPWPHPDLILDRAKIKDVELRQGWNTLLMGVSYLKDGWWLCGLRIRNEKGDVPTGLHYRADLAEPAKNESKQK